MQSGIYWGSIDMIEGLCRRIKAEYGKPMKTIATGGVASLFEGAFPTHRSLRPGPHLARPAGNLQAERRQALNKPHADDELVFLPLGGSGEIGMNLNAYGYGPPDDAQVDHRRYRRHVRARRHDAGRRSHPARSELSRRARATTSSASC